MGQAKNNLSYENILLPGCLSNISSRQTQLQLKLHSHVKKIFAVLDGCQKGTALGLGKKLCLLADSNS